jgi:prefoldin beta subunit
MASGGMVLPPKLAEIQTKMENESNEIKKIEAEFNKVVQGKRSLGEKKSENEMVMTELGFIDKDNATIYKLVGPVLAKQDFHEAQSSVSARLAYITKEIDRMDHLEKEFIGNVEDKKKAIMKMQNEFRAIAQQM